MRILIDPGHGGSDPGSVANGIIEKNINLIVSLKLKELLLKCGFDVKLSREADTTLSLTERCNMANAWGADYFISVHHNAGGGDGYEIIHSVRAGEGKDLAEVIGKEFNKLGQNCRRIFAKESTNCPGHDFYTVIEKTAMHAVITEYAFLDTADVQAVDTPEELINEASAIANAICLFTGKFTSIHWAQKYYDFLKSKGFNIAETRFDDSITRGELFKLMALLSGYKEE
jgi:N-acetylmuramoyl-L-alanine amidase